MTEKETSVLFAMLYVGLEHFASTLTSPHLLGELLFILQDRAVSTAFRILSRES